MAQKNDVVFKTSYIRVRRTRKGWCISFQCYIYPKDVGAAPDKGLTFWLDKLTKHFELAWQWIEEDQEAQEEEWFAEEARQGRANI